MEFKLWNSNKRSNEWTDSTERMTGKQTRLHSVELVKLTLSIERGQTQSYTLLSLSSASFNNSSSLRDLSMFGSTGYVSLEAPAFTILTDAAATSCSVTIGMGLLFCEIDGALISIPCFSLLRSEPRIQASILLQQRFVLFHFLLDR